jgi:hypothetical protein
LEHMCIASPGRGFAVALEIPFLLIRWFSPIQLQFQNSYLLILPPPKKKNFLWGFAHRRFVTRTSFERPMTENTSFERVQQLGSLPRLKKEAETASEILCFNYQSTMDDVNVLRPP